MRRQAFLFLLSQSLFVTGLVSSSISRKHNRRRFVSGTNLCPSVLSAQTVDDIQTKPDMGPAGQRVPTPRSTAVFSLMSSLKKKNPTFATRQLENDPNFLSLDRRDRAFARLLLATTERRQGQIEKVILKFTKSNKPTRQRPADLLCQAALRVGAAQLLFLDVKKYAALQETVEVLRLHPKIKVSKPQINFVNGMLRNIDRKGSEELESNTSIYDNIAPWLAEEWISIYGKEKTKTIIEASMNQSPIFLSVNYDPDSSEEERAAKLEKMKECFSTSSSAAQLLPHGSIEIPKQFYGGSVSKWPLYSEGEWWVQDPSASLPAIALYNALSKNTGRKISNMHIVDLCSAPGGKTAQLCSFGFGKVTAIEVSKRRTKPLLENMERLGMNSVCETKVVDGREWKPENRGDIHGVLVDVPCSATGVGSRRPDVLRKENHVIDELIPLQRELAAHTADKILAPGAIMVYATCSLLKRESEDQVNWILTRTEGAKMETLPITPGEIPGFDDAIDENGWLRVIPGTLPGSLSSCDGFFVARLRRIK